MPTIQGVVRAIFILIVMAAVVALLYWLIGFLSLPEPFTKVLYGVLAVGSVFAIITVLLELAGIPLIKFKGGGGDST